jgi:hypothetical protein
MPRAPGAPGASDLIGLVGRKGSGKDTAAEGLLAQGWVRLAFATPLREVVKTLFLLSDADCDDRAHKEQPGPMGVSYRRGMQAVGTELIRDQLATVLPEVGEEGFWIQHMRRQIGMARERKERVVITDVRFPDEAEAILALGGKLILVMRPGLRTTDSHSSETGVDEIAATWAFPVLTNARSKQSLRDDLCTLVGEVPSPSP